MLFVRLLPRRCFKMLLFVCVFVLLMLRFCFVFDFMLCLSFVVVCVGVVRAVVMFFGLGVVLLCVCFGCLVAVLMCCCFVASCLFV